jgi:hypothetical protein
LGISTSLQRNLNEGKEYNKLIPQVKCEQTNLGSGDTYMTVEEMKDWIEKYSFQTKKLSPKLKGPSIQTTVTNIYQFLYGHIQYQADGALQQLRSPACTWKQRKQGVDCKSYSIFASSILSNLGIKHFIRQIKQASFYPQEFTHVYIVIPVDQHTEIYSENTQTIVLDATKHQNIESPYLEKEDLKMVNLKHVGLNGPQNESTSQIAENFEVFSTHLLTNGISLNMVNAIREEVSKYTKIGRDPKFQIVDQGIIIEEKYFRLDFNPQNGLGFVVTGTAAVAGGKALLDMLPPDFLGNTFGSVFANGFDLSCWGASFSESKATAALEVDMPYLVGEFSGLSENPNTDTLNRFLNGIEGYILASVNGQNKKYAKCTQKGWAIAQKGAEGAKKQVLDSIKRAYNLISTGKQTGGLDTSMPSREGDNFKWGEHRGNAYKYESYRISKKENGTVPITNQPTYQSEADNLQPTSNANTNQNNPVAPKSNTGLIIGGVALATLPFLFMLKNQKPAKKNTK